MRVDGDDAGVGDEEAGTCSIERLEIDDGRLGAFDEFFQRQYGSSGRLHNKAGVDFSGEGVGSEREINLEVIGLEEPYWP